MSDAATVIRQARARARLSQVELAGLAGTSQPALARYEKGTVIPSLPTLERLLRGCGQGLEIRALSSGDRPSPASSMRSHIGPRARELRRRRRRLLDTAQRHGIRNVRVFGSLARGQAGPGSDIDMLVDLEPGRTLLDLAAFRREAEHILEVPVDVATPDMLKERMRAEVLAEALPL
jgi:uncharacterized protein